MRPHITEFTYLLRYNCMSPTSKTFSAVGSSSNVLLVRRVGNRAARSSGQRSALLPPPSPHTCPIQFLGSGAQRSHMAAVDAAMHAGSRSLSPIVFAAFRRSMVSKRSGSASCRRATALVPRTLSRALAASARRTRTMH